MLPLVFTLILRHTVKLVFCSLFLYNTHSFLPLALVLGRVMILLKIKEIHVFSIATSGLSITFM